MSTEEEALIVDFRKHTLLAQDDCLYVLQEAIPHLIRSASHCCLLRHGISRLPEVAEKPKKSRVKPYPIGYFHHGIAEAQTDEVINAGVVQRREVLGGLINDYHREVA